MACAKEGNKQGVTEMCTYFNECSGNEKQSNKHDETLNCFLIPYKIILVDTTI